MKEFNAADIFNRLACLAATTTYYLSLPSTANVADADDIVCRVSCVVSLVAEVVVDAVEDRLALQVQLQHRAKVSHLHPPPTTPPETKSSSQLETVPGIK